MLTNTTSDLLPRDDQYRPLAYVTMHDPVTRTRIMSVLERAGWGVIPQPTGFHLIQAIAGVIEGHLSWLRPRLIVVDAHSRGCSGITIAAGLRDLAITIPIVLVAADGEVLPVSTDQAFRVVDALSAEAVVGELAASGIVGGIVSSPSLEIRQAG